MTGRKVKEGKGRGSVTKLLTNLIWKIGRNGDRE